MELTAEWVLGVFGMALLFAWVGLRPLAYRSCGDCSGDCASCPLDEGPVEPGGRS